MAVLPSRTVGLRGDRKPAAGGGHVSEFSKATDALAELGIRAELHRQESGNVIFDVVGEVVDQWADEEGTWVTVLPQPPALDAKGIASPEEPQRRRAVEGGDGWS
jgi:hypothetical protein